MMPRSCLAPYKLDFFSKYFLVGLVWQKQVFNYAVRVAQLARQEPSQLNTLSYS